MGTRAANRTGILCVPVIDYILACDFLVVGSTQNNFNRSSEKADKNRFPLFLTASSIINVRRR
jgi:hypothetical protein